MIFMHHRIDIMFHYAILISRFLGVDWRLTLVEIPMQDKGLENGHWNIENI